MQLTQRLISYSVFCFLILFTFNGFSQTEEEPEKDLEAQYESLMKKSTTYQDYKVIKVVGLNQLWKNINDSLALDQSKYNKALREISSLNDELSTTKDSLETTAASLEDSNYNRDRISFIGIPLLKGAYNTIVWGIILILAIIVVVLFMRFMKSNSVTKSTRNDYGKLEEEFENYKKNARENEINLKRDLQTATNTIEDLKR
jgi:preprotein translocase subunit SecF